MNMIKNISRRPVGSNFDAASISENQKRTKCPRSFPRWSRLWMICEASPQTVTWARFQCYLLSHRATPLHLNTDIMKIYDEGGVRANVTLHEQQCSPTWLFIENSRSLQTDVSSAVSHNKSQAEQDGKHLEEKGKWEAERYEWDASTQMESEKRWNPNSIRLWGIIKGLLWLF